MGSRAGALGSGMNVPSEPVPSVKRRLAAVLSADVEGFSRLCGEDEAETLSALERHVDEVIKPTVRAHNGRITNQAGDGILAAFGSAVAAVKAAVEIQNAIVLRNEEIEPSRRLRFRVGLNLGEVVVKGGGIFGDGVNIAARAQAQALPDSVCATEAIVQQVRGKVGFAFHTMGKLKLKNIADPIHLFRLDPTEAEAGKENAGKNAARAAGVGSKPSIAVLPFLNLSGDLDQGYFSDGIAEDLITDLSRFRTITVIARNSSFGYRGGNVDVRKVADDLGVRFMVEGSVRKMQNRVRITVQLVNAETRAHVWAERYDTPLDGLFETQDEIVRHVVGSLFPRLEDETLAIARRKPTEMLQAYDCFLRGKAALYAATDAAQTEEARSYFEQAVAIDPDFAHAYGYLTKIYNNLTMHASPGQPIQPFRDKARQFAIRAIALDGDDPRAHIGLAWCHLWQRETLSARDHLEIAEKLNPNDAERAIDCGTGWMYLGEIERAIDSMKLGMRLNPHTSASVLADLSEAYFVAGRYDEMLRILERIPDQSPRSPAWKAAGLALAGDLDRARAEASRFVANLRALWAGDPNAGPADFVDWLIAFSPFCRDEDRDHFLRGLALAGLAGTGGNIARNSVV